MSLVIRNDMQTIGNRIRQVRLERRMTMEELAEKVGVQKSAINKYEKGMIEDIPQKRLEAIAYALDVSYEYLTTGYDRLSDAVIYYDELGSAHMDEQSPLQELIGLLQTVSPARYDLIKRILMLPPERLDALATLLNIEN